MALNKYPSTTWNELIRTGPMEVRKAEAYCPVGYWEEEHLDYRTKPRRNNWQLFPDVRPSPAQDRRISELEDALVDIAHDTATIEGARRRAREALGK